MTRIASFSRPWKASTVSTSTSGVERLDALAQPRGLRAVGRDDGQLARRQPRGEQRLARARRPAPPRPRCRGSGCSAPPRSSKPLPAVSRKSTGGASTSAPGVSTSASVRSATEGCARSSPPYISREGKAMMRRVHPVLLAQHPLHALAVVLEQPLEEAHRQARLRRLLREHGGRELLVVSGEHHLGRAQEGRAARAARWPGWPRRAARGRTARRRSSWPAEAGERGADHLRARRAPTRTALRSSARASSISRLASALEVARVGEALAAAALGALPARVAEQLEAPRRTARARACGPGAPPRRGRACAPAGAGRPGAGWPDAHRAQARVAGRARAGDPPRRCSRRCRAAACPAPRPARRPRRARCSCRCPGGPCTRKKSCAASARATASRCSGLSGRVGSSARRPVEARRLVAEQHLACAVALPLSIALHAVSAGARALEGHVVGREVQAQPALATRRAAAAARRRAGPRSAPARETSARGAARPRSALRGRTSTRSPGESGARSARRRARSSVTRKRPPRPTALRPPRGRAARGPRSSSSASGRVWRAPSASRARSACAPARAAGASWSKKVTRRGSSFASGCRKPHMGGT